jgi:hypothetical protein
MWFPFYFFQTIIDQYDWDADLHTPRQKTCNAVGGRTRISRTLLSFWLANNYKKTHLHPRKFLVNNWLDSFDDIPEKEIAKNYLLPKILSKSYISLSSEANGIELGTRLCGYTYQAYLGGNIILPIGNYEAIDVLEDLGFETFRDLFNFDSLKTDDLYKMSIGVLEDNRDILCDHEQIESFYLSNTARLKHNKRLISDREHFIEYFKPVIKHIKKALDLVPHDHPNFTRDLRHIGRALTWIKNFS